MPEFIPELFTWASVLYESSSQANCFGETELSRSRNWVWKNMAHNRSESPALLVQEISLLLWTYFQEGDHRYQTNSRMEFAVRALTEFPPR